MPKLIDLTKVASDAELPDFRLPKWIKADQIAALMRGTMSDTDNEDSDSVQEEVTDEVRDEVTEEESDLVHIGSSHIGLSETELKTDEMKE